MSVVRCGYHLRIFCEKKLPSDSILLAWLIRHAAWCLTRIQVKDDGRTAFVRVLGKAYTSQVLPFGERVMYKYTSVPTSNLDQRWGHGIWVGKAPVTDEDVILTENGVLRARSLHSVPLEGRIVISELKNVRGLPWNGREEKLGATVVTQQDQGPSGHRRVYVTTGVVARHGATPGCSGCVVLGPHTEACRVRLEKALADERADSVGTPVGPITELTSESHEPAPAAQQEPASSSSSPAAPMLTQNLQNEQRMRGSSRHHRHAQPRLSCGTESRHRLRLWTTRIPARRKPSMVFRSNSSKRSGTFLWQLVRKQWVKVCVTVRTVWMNKKHNNTGLWLAQHCTLDRTDQKRTRNERSSEIHVRSHARCEK